MRRHFEAREQHCRHRCLRPLSGRACRKPFSGSPDLQSIWLVGPLGPPGTITGAGSVPQRDGIVATSHSTTGRGGQLSRPHIFRDDRSGACLHALLLFYLSRRNLCPWTCFWCACHPPTSLPFSFQRTDGLIRCPGSTEYSFRSNCSKHQQYPTIITTVSLAVFPCASMRRNTLSII